MATSAQSSFLGTGDIFDWHLKFQSCASYFLDIAQYTPPVQAVAAFINIHLPFQKHPPTLSSRQTTRASPSPGPGASSSSSPRPGVPPPAVYVALLPYIRRLVATGFDAPGVLHGFFGDDWPTGVGPLHEVERRNYLFAVKRGEWQVVKRDYDMEDGQTIPFLRPLNVTEKEVESAEVSWREWESMTEWGSGVASGARGRSSGVKREREV